MRGRTIVLVVALALIPLATELHAAARDLVIKLGGGIAMPIDDFEDRARRGFIGSVDFDYLASATLALGIDVSYVAHGATDEREAVLSLEAGVPVSESLTLLPVGFHCKLLSTTSRLSPYVVLGLGLYSVTEHFESPTDSTGTQASESKFGARAGIGITYRISRTVGIEVEGVYHYVDTKIVTPLGDQVRPSTQFVGIQAGVTYGLATAAR